MITNVLHVSRKDIWLNTYVHTYFSDAFFSVSSVSWPLQILITSRSFLTNKGILL